ncbi:uncharacterized protein LOC144744305 [Ciona intestinalis]
MHRRLAQLVKTQKRKLKSGRGCYFNDLLLVELDTGGHSSTVEEMCKNIFTLQNFGSLLLLLFSTTYVSSQSVIHENLTSPVCPNTCGATNIFHFFIGYGETDPCGRCVIISCANEFFTISLPIRVFPNLPNEPEPLNLLVVSNTNCTLHVYSNMGMLLISGDYNQCGGGFYWKGESLVYTIVESIAYVSGNYYRFDLSYECVFKPQDLLFQKLLHDSSGLSGVESYRNNNKTNHECSSYASQFIIPAIGTSDVTLHFATLNTTGSQVHYSTLNNATFNTSSIINFSWTYHLPNVIKLNRNETFLNQSGIRVTTESQVRVVAFVEDNGKGASFSVLPTCAWGTEYVLIAYPSPNTYVIIISDAPDTSVDVFTKNGTLIKNINMTSSSAVRLVAGESELGLMSDLSGLRVTSNNKIGIISIMEDAQVPFNSSAPLTTDHMIEQLLPTSLWGWHYTFTSEASHLSGSILRVVCAHKPTTILISVSYVDNCTTTNHTIPSYSFIDVHLTVGATGILKTVDRTLFSVVMFGKSSPRPGYIQTLVFFNLILMRLI